MLDPADDCRRVAANPGDEDIRAKRNVTRTTLTALVAALALLVSAPAAGAAPAATSKATNTCWLDVINDWLDNNRVDKTYPTACYTHAIQTLNKYPDVQNYSSAADDIHRALLAAMHDRGTGGTNSGTGGGASGGGKNGGGTSGGGKNGGGTGSTPISTIFDSGKPSSAQSIPLPLLVLGGLAGLLLLSAACTWLVRRAQARRVGTRPTPAVEKHS
jgi:hypothetical protein